MAEIFEKIVENQGNMVKMIEYGYSEYYSLCSLKTNENVNIQTKIQTLRVTLSLKYI